jgi:hypothetical protein
MTQKRETFIIEILLSLILVLLIISLADRFQLERRQAQQQRVLDARSRIGIIVIDVIEKQRPMTEAEKRQIIYLKKEAGYPDPE